MAEGGSQRDQAREAMHALLDLADAADRGGQRQQLHDDRPAARDRRARADACPDDIALVAFDDFEWADLFAPRLTVIRQPTTELGSRAVELLLSRLEEPGRDAAHGAARGDVRAPKLMWVHRSFTCAADSSANL